jgi:hypothetical protein
MLRVGIPEGRGVLTYPDKSRYEGGFKKKAPHASILRHPAASTKSIEYAAVGSRRHGTGTLAWADRTRCVSRHVHARSELRACQLPVVAKILMYPAGRGTTAQVRGRVER